MVSTEVKDNQITLTLDQPIQSGKVETFEVAGADGKFANVTAIADGNVITIQSPITNHQSPIKVRYAWKDNPLKANVRSLNGLPMSSFEITIK